MSFKDGSFETSHTSRLIETLMFGEKFGDRKELTRTIVLKEHI